MIICVFLLNTIKNMNWNFFKNISFRRGNYLSEGYTPNFQGWNIGETNEIEVNTDDLSGIYYQCTHLKTVIDNIADLIGYGVWRCVDEDGVDVDNPLLDLLNNPNPIQNATEFKKNIYINQAVFGNAFVYKNSVYTGTELEQVKQMWVLKSDHIKINPTGKFYKQNKLEDIITGYSYDNGIVNDKFKTKEIIKFKQSGIELLIEPSKIKTLQPQIYNLVNAYQSRGTLIANRGPNWLISPKVGKGEGLPHMSGKIKDAVEKKFTEDYGIGKNQKKINWSSIGVDATSLNFKTSELMLFEEVDDNFNCIIDAYGYNRNLLSTIKGSTFENVKESLKLVMQNTVIPQAEQISNSINASANKGQGKFIIDYSHLPIMQANRKEEAEVMNITMDAYSKLMGIETSTLNRTEFEQNLLSLLKS